MFAKARETVKKFNLIQKGDTILIGVSGGPDSVALLYLLKSLSRQFKLKLHVAHLDHMLRKESQEDANFVRRLSEKLKIPATITNINVLELSVKGSQEEIARNARFGFLFNLAKKIKAQKIALGHNLDDQAETILMRIIRGAGLYGLSGILPKRDISGFCIIRPLIETRRREIDKFLKSKKIKARIDQTNKEEIYFRNKIRKNLLPILEKQYNKNIKDVLSNAAQTIGYDYDYLSIKARETLKKFRNKLNLKKFLVNHIAIRRMVLRFCIMKLKGDMRKIDFRHVKEIEDLIRNRPEGSIVDLPKGVSITKKQGFLVFKTRKV